MIVRRGSAFVRVDARAARYAGTCARYQPPMRVSSAIAISAAIANQATLVCPRGITMNAASSGPIAEPTLPPTWNSDCANPCCPPDAMRATREDSGWNTDEPEPISAAASSSSAKLGANESSSSPVSVKPMPIASEYGIGFRSV